MQGSVMEFKVKSLAAVNSAAQTKRIFMNEYA
jgi:hypothetical protein